MDRFQGRHQREGEAAWRRTALFVGLVGVAAFAAAVALQEGQAGPGEGAGPEPPEAARLWAAGQGYLTTVAIHPEIPEVNVWEWPGTLRRTGSIPAGTTVLLVMYERVESYRRVACKITDGRVVGYVMCDTKLDSVPPVVQAALDSMP